MTQQTVYNTIRDALASIGVTAPDTIFVSSPTTVQLQLASLYYDEAKYLRNQRIFPQQKKAHSFQLIGSRALYPLPQDFYAALPGTQWNQSNRFPLLGPLSDSDYAYRLYGTVSFENLVAYRIFGPDINPVTTTTGQFQVNPTPGATTEGQRLAFDYVCAQLFTPPVWAASTAYTQNTSYAMANGKIYRCSTSGTSGSIPPNFKRGNQYNTTLGEAVAQDGTMYWTFVPAWTATTQYFVGDYVNNNSKIYKCTTGGVSAGSGGPSVTSGTETDGTVVWTWESTPDAWVAGTTYTATAFVKVVAQTHFYKATQIAGAVTPNGGGTSGTIAPNFTYNTITDGTVVWGGMATPYDTIQGDTDLNFFDDDIMKAGFKWRYLEAKKLDFARHKQEHDDMVSSAKARWFGSYKVSLAVPMTRVPSPNLPEGSWGIS